MKAAPLRVLAIFLLICVTAFSQNYPLQDGVAYVPAESGNYTFPNANWTSGVKPRDLWVTFTVNCTNSVSIGLAHTRATFDGENINAVGYHIAMRNLVGYGPSAGIFRNGELVKSDTLVHCPVGTLQAFWVRYLSDVLTIGTNSLDQNAFLSFKDPSPLWISFFDFSRGAAPAQFYDLEWGNSPPRAGSDYYIPANYFGQYNFPNANWTSEEKHDLSVTFTADCLHDIHIVLSPSRAFASIDNVDRYEIVIGGWQNTRSVIRRHLQGDAYFTDFQTRCVPGTKKPFWVRYFNDELTVGAGTLGRGAFLQYTDPNPLDVSYFDFGQWDEPVYYYDIAWGFSLSYVPSSYFGQYAFPNPQWNSSKPKDLWVTFTAHCNNDARLVFSPNRAVASPNSDSVDRYEIVIGGSSNQISGIRRNLQDAFVTNTSRVLCSGSSQNFWARYLEGMITVGTGADLDQNVFLSYYDPSPLEVVFFDFGQWDKPVMYSAPVWGSSSPHPDAYHPAKYLGAYTFPNAAWTGTDIWVTFAAMCSPYFYLALSPSRSPSPSDAYEIVVDGYGNSKSEIRRGLQGITVASEIGVRRCYPGNLVSFWARYLEGTVSVGTGSLTSAPFMKFPDPNPLGASFFDLGQWDTPMYYYDIQWGSSPAPPPSPLPAVPSSNYSFTPTLDPGHYMFPNPQWTSERDRDIWLTFSVDCSNVRVVFSPDRSYATGGSDPINRYEIVFYAKKYSDRDSLLRRHLEDEQSVDEVVAHGRIASPCENGTRLALWARYRNGVVTVGSGQLDQNAFISYTDPNPIDAPFFDLGRHDLPAHFYDIKWGNSLSVPNPSPYSPTSSFGVYNFPNAFWTGGNTRDLWVTFKANCISDVLIVLSPDRTPGIAGSHRYEIAIATLSNTKSTIVGRTIPINTLGLCEPGQRQSFWVRLLGAKISVGTGELDRNEFLSYIDVNPSTVNYFDFGQAYNPVYYSDIVWGSTRAPPLSVPGSYVPSSFYGVYTYPNPDWTSGKIQDLWISFTANCSTDIRVALSPKRFFVPGTDWNSRYDIVIGGSANSVSYIRKTNEDTDLVVNTASGRCVPGTKMPYWISYLNRNLTVGSGKYGMNAFMSSNQVSIDGLYFDLGQWDKPVIYDDILWGSSDRVSPYIPANQYGVYDFPNPDWTAGNGSDIWVSFEVAAANNARVMLCPNRTLVLGGYAADCYEIVIGDKENTQSSIYKRGSQVATDSQKGRCQLPAQAFWVRYYDGLITVGTGALGQNVFFNYKDYYGPFKASYFDFGRSEAPTKYYKVAWGDSSTFPSDNGSPLSTAATIGLAVGCSIALMLATAIAIIIIRRHRRHFKSAAAPLETGTGGSEAEEGEGEKDTISAPDNSTPHQQVALDMASTDHDQQRPQDLVSPASAPPLNRDDIETHDESSVGSRSHSVTINPPETVESLIELQQAYAAIESGSSLVLSADASPAADHQ